MSRTSETQRQGQAPPAARMAGGERRRQILQVAMRLFSQRGFRGTTTKEIARAAGVSEAMVFRHFATKEELYSAILDHKSCSGGMADPFELLGDAIARRDDAAVFSGLARAMMAHHEADTEFMRLLTHAALERHELAEMFWERNVRQLYDFLGGYIRGRQREGALREIEPAVVVRAFVGMVIHHSLNNLLWDPKRRLLDITDGRAAEEFTGILLRGVAAQQSGPRAGGGKARRPATAARGKRKR